MNKVLTLAVAGSFGLTMAGCSEPPADTSTVAVESQVAEPAAATEESVADLLAQMPSGSYDLDTTHAYVTFTYSHLGFSNPHVGFSEFDVDLNLDSANPANSTLSMTINADSIYSRVAKFDEHLKAEDLFDTANYPEITYVANGIELAGSKITMNGDLTIKGITKPVTVEGQVNKAAMHPMLKKPTLGISAEAKISRSDWGLDLAVPAVGDDVTIYIEIEMPKGDEA